MQNTLMVHVLTDVGSKASLLEILLVIFTLDISQDAIRHQLVKAAKNKKYLDCFKILKKKCISLVRTFQ